MEFLSYLRSRLGCQVLVSEALDGLKLSRAISNNRMLGTHRLMNSYKYCIYFPL